MTIDRNDPLLRETHQDGPLKGQQKAYLVLSEEERQKGFIRPVRYKYKHVACGCVTTMWRDIAETYSRSPKFYSGTFCSWCKDHFDLVDQWGQPAFLWEDGEPVGSNAEEATQFLDKQSQRETAKNSGAGI